MKYHSWKCVGSTPQGVVNIWQCEECQMVRAIGPKNLAAGTITGARDATEYSTADGEVLTVNPKSVPRCISPRGRQL